MITTYINSQHLTRLDSFNINSFYFLLNLMAAFAFAGAFKQAFEPYE
jgi:hypothetical protein